MQEERALWPTGEDSTSLAGTFPELLTSVNITSQHYFPNVFTSPETVDTAIFLEYLFPHARPASACLVSPRERPKLQGAFMPDNVRPIPEGYHSDRKSTRLNSSHSQISYA